MDDGETDALADAKDSDDDKEQPMAALRKQKDAGETDTPDDEEDSDDDKDYSALIDRNQPCPTHDPDNSDDDQDPAPQIITDLDIDPEMPELVDLPRLSHQAVARPRRRRQRAPRIGRIPKDTQNVPLPLLIVNTKVQR